MTEQELIEALDLTALSPPTVGGMKVYVSEDCPRDRILVLNPACIHFEPLSDEELAELGWGRS